MDAIVTLSERGQVVIPQPIRKLFGLRPLDKIYFKVKGDRIVVKPLLSVEEAFGIIKTRKKISKDEYKKMVLKKVINKFKE